MAQVLPEIFHVLVRGPCIDAPVHEAVRPMRPQRERLRFVHISSEFLMTFGLLHTSYQCWQEGVRSWVCFSQKAYKYASLLQAHLILSHVGLSLQLLSSLQNFEESQSCQSTGRLHVP